MAVIKKYEVKTETGDIESYDIGAEAGNVSTSDGSDVEAALAGKAPTNHRSTSTTYGTGTSSYYGHVKLSDSVASSSGASSGVAATPAAVKTAYNAATAAQNDVDDLQTEMYYPEYHADKDAGDFYLDCANVDNAGTALFKVSIRDVTKWCDLKSGAGFSITEDNIASDGIVSADGALTANINSYAGFNTSSSFTILFNAKISQLSSSDDESVIFQLGNTRVLQIHQKGVDGIRLVTYDEDKETHVYPAKLENGSDMDGGAYTTGHYVVPIIDGGSAYGSYVHFAIVFDTSAETVTWYQNGSVYSTDEMADTYVKVDGGYDVQLLSNAGNGLRYFKIVRKAMSQAEIQTYMNTHPHSNYTGQPKTSYDNILTELEQREPIYATCSTAAATAAKNVTYTLSAFELITGVRVAVMFTYANTASSPTLNVNNTGAKAIYANGSAASSSNSWSAGEVVEFVYTGTQWKAVGGDKGWTHKSYSTTAATGTALTPSFGESVTVVTSMTTTKGHITSKTTTAITIPNSEASSSAAGLMSSSDKSKLDGIATGATKNSVDSALSTTSTNAVQNKVIAAEITAINTDITELQENLSSKLDTDFESNGFVGIDEVTMDLPVCIQNTRYSETPIQVGTWIDSTPVWRQAFNITFTAAGMQLTDKMVNVDLQVSDYNKVFIIGGFASLRMGNSPCAIDDEPIGAPNDLASGFFDFSGIESGYLSGLTNGDSGAYGWLEFVTSASNIKS